MDASQSASSDAGMPRASGLVQPDARPLQRAGEVMVPVPMAELFAIAARQERAGKPGRKPTGC